MGKTKYIVLLVIITVDEAIGYLYGLNLINEEIYRYDIRKILD